MYKTVMRNNVNSIEQFLTLKLSAKKNSTVIDVTDFINADNDVVSLILVSRKDLELALFKR